MLSKLVSVIHVRVVVFGDHHSVGELAAGEGLHGFLTVRGGDVLHEDLEGKTSQFTMLHRSYALSLKETLRKLYISCENNV